LASIKEDKHNYTPKLTTVKERQYEQSSSIALRQKIYGVPTPNGHMNKDKI
jgi:hypothetical protein